MQRHKFTNSQIMEILKQVEVGLAASNICRELVISILTFYNLSL